MLTVSAITHIAIKVKDVERSLAFYVGQLGFSEMLRLHRDNGELWLVYLRITDTQYLEIFPNGQGDSAPSRDITGYNHMCLEVPDIDQALRELEDANVTLLRGRTEGADGNLQAWIVDPDGHHIELMQMSPTGMQAAAIARMKER